MALQKTESAETLTTLDLKALTTAKPPCITLSLPFETADFESLEAARIRLKDLLKQLEEELAGIVADKAQRQTLLDPLRDLSGTLRREGRETGIVLFRSQDVFTSIRTSRPIAAAYTIADHFRIREILPQLTGANRFWLLSLAQKGVRLLHCTESSFEEAPLPVGTPHTYDEWASLAKPDHVLDNSSPGGPSEGSMKGVMFGTSTDREDRNEYLKHFYRDVSNGIRPVLKKDPGPLVLAGVEYELPIYHDIDTWEHTVPDGVHGAPRGLGDAEMHSRALELVRPAFEEPLRKALEAFDSVSAERRSSTAKDIVKAAWDGRIAHLILNEAGEYRGWFREATGEVKAHGKGEGIGEEDLLNAAAVRTLGGGGNVFVVPGSKVPGGAPAAAVFRW